MKNLVNKLETLGEFVKASRLEKLISSATKEMTYKNKPISEQEALKLVKEDVRSIQFIRNPTKKVQIKVVKKRPDDIYYIKNPDEEVKLIAVKRDASAIEYIKNPSEEIQLEAVKQTGFALQWIKKPTEAVQLIAVKQDGRSIQFIKNPSTEVQFEAVEENREAMEFIKNPSDEFFKYLEKKSQVKDYNPEYEFNDNDLFLIKRYMDKHGLTSISIRELKKEFVITPVVQNLISSLSGKDLTVKSLIEFDKSLDLKEEEHVDLKELLKHSKLLKSEWKDKSQRIFKDKNHVFLLGTPVNKVKNKKLLEYSEETNHPALFGFLTLIWIRYTKFKDYIWIDEVQSDLDKVAEINTKNLYHLILKKFIQYHSSKGFKVFYYPTYEIKRKFYKADPPASIYKDLPKKFRFKLLDKVDFDTKNLNVKKKGLNEEKVWKLEARLN